MKKVILLSLMFVYLVGYSQVPNIEDLEDGDVVIQGTDTVVQFDEREFDENDPNLIYSAVQTMPQYPEGNEKLTEFIAKNFKNSTTDRDLKGRVILQFIVEKDGSLSDIKVLRDLGYGTGKEAIRVLKLTEKWNAGLQNGKPVRVRHTIVIQVDVKANQE